MNSPIVLSVIAAIAVLIFVYGVSRLLSISVSVSDRLNLRKPTASDGDEQQGGRKKTALTQGVDKAVANTTFAAGVARDLARADLKLTVSEYLALHVISLVGCFSLVFIATGQFAFGTIAGIVGLAIPRIYVKFRQKKRLKAFNSQLTDTLMLVVSSLRSGYSLLQSLEVVAKESPVPSKEEFSRVVREVGLGLSPEEALANLVRRMGSDDLDMVVTAINVQHEVGGNLAHVLESVAQTIRERVKLRGEISVMTAQQRISGYVITAMPVGLGALIFVINPDYMMQLFSFEKVICMPAIGLPICSGVMMIAGFLVMRRIVNGIEV